MLLKIGELAKRTGLTVRTLHHYDKLGLLSPSGRSEAGYRLYNQTDVMRLYRVLALRQLGLPLADIGTALAGDGTPMPDLIDRQLRALDAQIQEAESLRKRLHWLRHALQDGTAPTLSDWLTTLELMTVHEKYFTPGELAELEARRTDPVIATAQAAWPALIAEVRALMMANTPVTEPAVQNAAQRWQALVHQFTGSNPDLLIKSALMLRQEGSMQAHTGIEPAMMNYIGSALAELKLAIYAQYLTAAEMVRMRAHYGKNPAGWLPLITDARKLLNEGASPDSPEAKAIAQRWEGLTREFAGTDPATRERLRAAYVAEPDLLARTGIDAALLDFIRAAGADVTG